MELTGTNRSIELDLIFCPAFGRMEKSEALFEIELRILQTCKNIENYISSKTSGDLGGGATPVPIPNTAVKPSSADGTAQFPVWESRTLPD